MTPARRSPAPDTLREAAPPCDHRHDDDLEFESAAGILEQAEAASLVMRSPRDRPSLRRSGHLGQ
jgi:hypothetical protein